MQCWQREIVAVVRQHRKVWWLMVVITTSHILFKKSVYTDLSWDNMRVWKGDGVDWSKSGSQWPIKTGFFPHLSHYWALRSRWDFLKIFACLCFIFCHFCHTRLQTSKWLVHRSKVKVKITDIFTVSIDMLRNEVLQQ